MTSIEINLEVNPLIPNLYEIQTLLIKIYIFKTKGKI